MGEAKAVRAAVYARVSTLDQNPDLQLRELREFSRRRGWTIVEFVDHGISGAETRRPRLAALTESLQRRQFDVVLVWKFDRLFRSVQHIVQFFGLLQHLKIDFVSVTEQIDTGSPSGKLIFHVLAAIAEFEREMIRERVLAGMRAAKARGTICHRPRKQIDEARVIADHRLLGSCSKVAKIHGCSKTLIVDILNGNRGEKRKGDR
ncbi:MAG TPA: recombinase family protein [Candidatus Acidoferrum sp.]|nr:recombinase family protein [Candidatus Acidoferrum sp.]